MNVETVAGALAVDELLDDRPYSELMEQAEALLQAASLDARALPPANLTPDTPDDMLADDTLSPVLLPIQGGSGREKVEE